MPHRSSPLPPSVLFVLKILLPEKDRENLLDCYEKDYVGIQSGDGPRKARHWLLKQVISALFLMSKIKLSGELTMLRNFVMTSFRHIVRHKGYAFINIAGLSVGMACCLLIFLWVNHEWDYDRFHENSPNIYRTVCHWTLDNNDGWTWRTPPPLAQSLRDAFPEIQQASRFYWRDGFLVEYGDKRFKENIGFADSSLFTIFSLPLSKETPRAFWIIPSPLSYRKQPHANFSEAAILSAKPWSSMREKAIRFLRS